MLRDCLSVIMHGLPVQIVGLRLKEPIKGSGHEDRGHRYRDDVETHYSRQDRFEPKHATRPRSGNRELRGQSSFAPLGPTCAAGDDADSRSIALRMKHSSGIPTVLDDQ